MTNQSLHLRRAADLAVLIGCRPTEILEVEDAPGCWRLVVDYTLVMQARERLASGNEESDDEMIRRMRALYEGKWHG